jgi:uncharacterized membrane protein YdcZ (DUF606 family)
MESAPCRGGRRWLDSPARPLNSQSPYLFVILEFAFAFSFTLALGAGPVNGLIITANLLASLAIDHFGLMNVPVHALNAGRAIGGLLMAAGIVLIFRF